MKNTTTCSLAASETVAFAAQELASYLGRMLPEEALPEICLRVSGESGQLDSYSVQVAEGGGTIEGCNERSVLLGVYDYLHHLGCRFLGPGEECEIVPVIPLEKLTADYTKTASFRHRGVCIEGASSVENVLAFIDWLPKVGYNSFFLQFKVPYTFLARWYHHERNPYAAPQPYSVADAAADMGRLEAAMRKRGLLLHKVGHGWTGETLGYESVAWEADSRPLTPEKRRLVAEVGGVRELCDGVPLNTNLCYHSGEAIDAFAGLVVEYARSHPTVDYLHIWLADACNNICECEDCCQTTPSDQYVELLNEIDRRLTAEGLETRLVFLLYQELLWPPVRERLKNPERFVLMFAPISRTFERSYSLDGPREEIPPYRRNHITLPTSLEKNLAYLQGWQQQFQGDSFVYDYPLGRAHYGDFGYVHISRIISGDIKKLRQMGLDGYISCQELRASLPNGLPNYVMGYTLFDEGAKVEDLIHEYFSAAYGTGEEEAYAYLSRLSQLSSCDYANGKGSRLNPDMAERMEKAVDCCERFEAVLAEHRDKQGHWDNLYWKLLGYHCQVMSILSRSVGYLARGEELRAEEEWLAFRELICRNEPEYQPYLDVYRILQITANFTGLYKGR